MVSTQQRPEIADSHVPLAFLLGRRASEYKLPTLLTHVVTPRHTPRDISLFQNDKQQHVRQREAQAKQLLARVLAQESRVDTHQQYEFDSPLDVPLARITTADRRRRAVELDRVLTQHEESLSDTTVETTCVLLADRDSNISGLYDQRELFASTHGYVPREPDFVEVVGNPARIQRAQSLRQFHEDEKRRRAKQFKAKQARIPMMQAELLAQQAETKRKLHHAEQKTIRKDPQADGSRIGMDAIRSKQTSVKQRKDEQQRQRERTKGAGISHLRHRHELVQQVRQASESNAKDRQASSELMKKTMATIRGVGPSFVSTLRVESADGNAVSERTGEGPLLLEAVASDAEPEDDASRLGDRLQGRQYELFQQSQTRSLHLGGGFASKPRDESQRQHKGGDSRQDDDAIAARATGLSLLKSKRHVQDEWRKTLSVHH